MKSNLKGDFEKMQFLGTCMIPESFFLRNGKTAGISFPLKVQFLSTFREG
jgi:hypothetical protein